MKIKIPPPEAPPVADMAAEKEEQSFADDTVDALRSDHKRKDMTRGDKLRHFIFCATAAFIVTVAAVGVLAILSLAWHYMAPEYWQYLTGEQVATIKNLILSGASGALVTTAVNNYLKS